MLPSGEFGPQSRINGYAYEYADRTKHKERRYVLFWLYPFAKRL